MEPITIGIASILVTAVIGGVQIYQNRNKKELKRLSTKTEVIHNIPHRNYFVGRDTELITINEALISRSFIISITGIGGIGKTSLAIEVAYRVLRQKKFDKIIWVSDKESSLNINRFCQTIIGIFGKHELLKLETEQLQVKSKELLSNYKCLLIVDNFETIVDNDIINFVKSIPEPSKVLVTSREKTLEETKVIKISGLKFLEAKKIIASKSKEIGLGKQFEKVKKEDLLNLTQVCGGHPLALKWAIGQIANGLQTFESISNFIYEGGHDIFSHLFDNSWPYLTVNERVLLETISLFKSPINIDILKIATKINSLELNKSIVNLSRYSMIDRYDIDSFVGFSSHEITRNYVINNIEKNKKPVILKSINSAYTFHVSNLLSTKVDNYLFIDNQISNIYQAIDYGLDDDWESSKKLLLNIKWFLWERGFWDIRNKLYQKVINHSNAVLTEDNLILFASDISWVYFRQGRLALAKKWFEKAESLSFAKVNSISKSAFYSVKGMMQKVNKDYDNAEQNLRLALKFCDSNDSSSLEKMRIMTYLGELNRSIGNIDEANNWFKATLDLAKEKKYRAGESWSYQNLATLKIVKKDNSEAITLLNKSLLIAEDINRLHTIAECKFLLSSLFKQDDQIKSKRLLREANEIYTTLGYSHTYNFKNR